jgi:hypothetical protein
VRQAAEVRVEAVATWYRTKAGAACYMTEARAARCVAETGSNYAFYYE